MTPERKARLERQAAEVRSLMPKGCGVNFDGINPAGQFVFTGRGGYHLADTHKAALAFARRVAAAAAKPRLIGG